MRRSLLALSLLAATAACGPSRKPPVDVMGLVLGKNGAYETRQITLNSVSDILSLKGSVATLVGGARIVIDSSDPLLQINGGNLTDQQLLDVFVKGKGMDPRASYIDKNGLLWPADFHTWNMVTTVYNFEKSFEYFQGTYDGKPSGDLLGSTVYYFPSFTMTEVSQNPLTDNALYFPPIQGFAVLPFEQLQKVPLSINLGVIGHEFSHRVFNRKVYDGKSVPEPLIRWVGVSASTPGVNLLKSIDEGLADFHAWGVTCLGEYGCNSRFLAHSVNDEVTDERDLAKPDKCMTAGYRNAMTTLPVGSFTG
ncbi:MAG: hypothetical protein HYZ28_08810, partial [Myxococcales bacterium]|nr:hypothetical protein [Myxococcales bacterium]